MAKTARAARCCSELTNFDQLSMSDRRDDELRNSLIRPDCNGMLTQVDDDDFHLAPIVGIDRAWRIQQCQPVFERSTASRANLALKSWWYFDGNSGRDGSAGEWGKHHRFGKRRLQIHARGIIALIAWQRSAQTLNLDYWDNQRVQEKFCLARNYSDDNYNRPRLASFAWLRVNLQALALTQAPEKPRAQVRAL